MPDTAEQGPITWLYTSPDGESWEMVLESAHLEIAGLMAGGPGYVLVGTRYLPPGASDLHLAPWAAWSADGETWQEADIVLPTLDTVGRAVSSLDLTPGGVGVAAPMSADGPTIAGAWISDLVATRDGFVALGHSQDPDHRTILWTSVDGSTWIPEASDPFGDDVTVRRLAAGTDVFVAYGHRDAGGDQPGALLTWYSSDAVHWAPAVGDPSFEDAFGAGPLVAGVVAVGDGLVMLGTEWVGPPMAWVSTDGRTWGAPSRLPSLSETSAEIRAVAASPDWVVAVGREVTVGDDAAASQHPGIWASSDGVEWSQVPPEMLRGSRTEAGISVHAVAWVDDGWLALGTVWDYPDEVPTSVAWTGR
ncbi:hypothetical protein [Actinotalea sp.]|uniref:hypothetical protein n=1 Tax=Actinotalea sp. TaxID=1872145 RepID=UPI003568E20E